MRPDERAFPPSMSQRDPNRAPRVRLDVRRVAVLGSRGHLGQRILSACQERSDLAATGSSRKSEVRARAEHEESRRELAVDVLKPKTWHALGPFDVVINATDTSKAWPLGLAEHCLREGQTFVETSADPEVARALGLLNEDGPGTIVLAAGAFPGLSTQLLEQAVDGESVEFRARWSVLSGAGRGTVGVMVEALKRPSLVHDGQEFQSGPPLGPLVQAEIEGRTRTFVPLAMADVALAAQPGTERHVRFLASADPQLPRFLVGSAVRLAAFGILGWSPVAFVVGLGLRVLRVGLLGKKSTAIVVELHHGARRVAGWSSDDAFAAGAAHAAVVAALWPSDRPGVRLPHEGVPLARLKSELGSLVQFS